MNIQSRRIHPASLVAAAAAVLLTFSLGTAGAAPSGYLTDSSGAIVHNDFKECWHTSGWSPANAVEECEPHLVSRAEPESAPVAAMEPAPPPQPTMRKMSLSADAYFGFDKAELNPQGKQKLDRIAQALRNAHSPSIQIVGHADRIGPAGYNQKLSMQRAQSVKDYLVQQGVPADTIQVSAVGSSQPAVTCEGKRGQALIQCLSPNRRTDVEFSAFEPVQPNDTNQ
ncbi:MAG TPA: OmpA family protein [Gammaproteobacteria bacterium]|nr:OmpA family protein [Gammaproteobacteria bacterium]